MSFIRNYLTKDLAQREDMYLFQKQGKEYKVVDKQWEQVCDQLVGMRVNGGFPYITVNDGDYMKNRELYLVHNYEDIELDVKYLEKAHIHHLWGRPVHMENKIEQKPVLFGKQEHFNDLSSPFSLYDLLIKIVGDKNIPILTNVDIGYTFPSHVFPIGIKVSLNASEDAISFLENGVLELVSSFYSVIGCVC